MQYSNDNRGKIQHKARARQINDFSSLRYGKITPTDIDGLLDFQDKAFVIFEVKYLDAEIPFGQRLAMERVCTGLIQSGRKAIALHISHNVANPEHDVDVSIFPVVKYFHNRKWTVMEETKSCKEVIDGFLIKCGVMA